MGAVFDNGQAQGQAGFIGGEDLTRIAIVEDDDNIRELVCYALTASGFKVESFEDGNSFFRAAESGKPDLLLLDIMLPGEDGMTILKKIKSGVDTKNIPVIMLTAKAGELDRVKGLDLGADDYVVKPFSVIELTARIKAVLRRCGSAEGQIINVGAVSLDTGRRIVTVNGEDINLTFKEFELFNCLASNIGLVLTRDKLTEKVWGFDYEGESRTLDMHIKTLRQKLGEGSGIIKTVRNVGYKIEEPEQRKV